MRIGTLIFALSLPVFAQEAAPAQKNAIPAEPTEAAYPALERFINVMEMTKARHPDVEKLSYDQLINQALDGMLSSLDPHSSFIHPEMQEMMDKDGKLNNEVASLGLSLGKNSEQLYLSAIEANGPAALAKLTPDMKVLQINKQDASKLSLKTALELLVGNAGQTAQLLVQDPTKPDKSEVTLTHRYIEERSLILAKLLDKNPQIGYLRLAQFGSNCAREIEAALDELEDKGMKSLILDLRENGGGDLHETVQILGLFTPPNTSVVSVRERNKAEEFIKTPERQRRNRPYPIVVLIDRHSASASELTAGSLKDLKRAKIIGERSYGKGSVQNIIPMGNSTALRLTIATYHTPSGETPHLKGIDPDIVVPFNDTDRDNFLKAARVSSLSPKEKEAFDKWTDPAIAEAINLLK
ncbi:MAG: S41 family peptidase [Akkermansiaceae bacterium]|jgi:carboxyl-terminal processing protease